MSKRVQRRKLLIIDIAAYLMSFLFGYLFRYHSFSSWEQFKLQNDGIYPVVLTTSILLYFMLYFYRNSRHKAEKNIPLAAQDPFDQIVSVVKTQLFVFGMLLVILFSIHKGSVVSRTVLGISFITCIILDGILHLLYGRHLREMLLKHPVIRKLLLVSCLSDISVAIHHLEKSDRSLSVCAVLPVDQTVWQQNEINGIPVIPLNGGCLPDLSQREIREAFLYFPDAKVCPSEIINMLESQNITIHHAIMLDGMAAGERLIGKLGCYQTVTEKDMHQRCDILGVHFVPANISGAVFYVRKHIHDLQGRYICFCNVHTTVESYRDPQYCAIQNGAALTLADGAPIMKQEQKRGFADAERVAGPDFMTRMFESTMDGKISHYFYGSKEETLLKLKQSLQEKYPGIDIRGLYSPPFRALTPEEDEADIRRINESGADIVWIGLGAPKQEKWMAAHQGKIHGVMMGVGAGFDFHAGTIRRAPVWMQKISMEWLYRLFQDPKRLIRRYFISNVKFLWYSVKDSFAHPDNGNG